MHGTTPRSRNHTRPYGLPSHSVIQEWLHSLKIDGDRSHSCIWMDVKDEG